MKKGTKWLLCALSLCFVLIPARAGERTIPVDIFLMVDKSLSMAEPGKFESMHRWVRDQLIGQILIDGDWITIYDFYGVSQNLLTAEISGPADRDRVISAIDGIKPDGKYTDIGLALDTIKEALEKRGTNGRHKIMLLLSDLKQEAPWTSRYAGSPESFESPYLAEARIIQHDAWYEITLDMDIQDKVVKASKDLFASIEENKDSPIGTAPTGSRELAEGPADGTSGDGTSGDGTSDGSASKGLLASITRTARERPALLALALIPLALVVGGVIALVRTRRRADDDNTKVASSSVTRV